MHDTNLLEDQPIAWTPTADVVERARLTKFMRQVGVSNWAELYEFSIRDVEKFTEEVLKFLDIKFDPPYDKLLDISDGVEFPKWFSTSGDSANSSLATRHVSPLNLSYGLCWGRAAVNYGHYAREIPVHDRHIIVYHPLHQRGCEAVILNVNACLVTNLGIIVVQLKVADVNAIIGARQEIGKDRALIFRGFDRAVRIEYQYLFLLYYASETGPLAVIPLEVNAEHGLSVHPVGGPLVLSEKLFDHAKHVTQIRFLPGKCYIGMLNT